MKYFFERRKSMKKLLVVLVAIAALTCLLAVPAFSADKLIVKDSTNATGFIVTDAPAVGVGTATPAAKLSVTDQVTVANRGFVGSQNTTDAASAALILRKSRGTEAAPAVVSNGDYIGTFQFRGYDGTSYLRNAFIGSKVNGTVSGGSVPSDLFFATSANDTSDPYASGAVRIVINGATGNVGIGTTTPQYLLDVNGQIRVQTTVYSSSRKLKDNIVDLKSAEAMDAVEKLNPVKFNYKNSPSVSHIGFIAEDVPDLVAQKNRVTIDPMDVVAVLTKVVQEQNKTIAELSAKLNKLESQVARIKSKDMFGSIDPSMPSGN